VAWLDGLGVVFSRDDGRLRILRCGGASRPRLLQAGERTGAEMVQALRRAVRASGARLQESSPLAVLEPEGEGWLAGIRPKERDGLHDTDTYPHSQLLPGLVVYRFDAPLIFANSRMFGDTVRAMAEERPDLRWVLVAAEPMTDVDTTAADVLGELLDDLQSRGIALAFAELKGPVKDRLRDYGLADRVGDDRFFPTLGTAIDGYLAATGIDWVDWSDEVSDDDTGID
jgi:MFS superfamily sulfate permease-like transporter